MEQTQESKFGKAELEAEVVEYLQLGVAITSMLMAVKESDHVKFILRSIPALAGELKPLMEGTSDFFTEMDIKAVRKMEAAGISQENAVALRIKSNSHIFGGFLKVIDKELKTLRGVESKTKEAR